MGPGAPTVIVEVSKLLPWGTQASGLAEAVEEAVEAQREREWTGAEGAEGRLAQ